jgi:hypothetical protein
MKSQELRQLGDILMNALCDLEKAAERYLPNGLWPPLDSPKIDRQVPQNIRPEIQRPCNVIIAAAYQLINVVRDPFLSLVDAAGAVSSHHYVLSVSSEFVASPF